MMGFAAGWLVVMFCVSSFLVDWVCHVYDRSRPPGLTLRRPR